MNVIDFGAHRSIRRLRERVADVDGKIKEITELWAEVGPEAHADQTVYNRFLEVLTKALKTKRVALEAIALLEKRATNVQF